MSSVVLQLINPQKGSVNFFLGPKQRISEPPRRAAKIFSHIMKGGEYMEYSTIVDTSIDMIMKICGYQPQIEMNKTEQTSLDKLTFDDVKQSIDTCIKKLQA